MTPDQKDELLTKMAEALRGLQSAARGVIPFISFETTADKKTADNNAAKLSHFSEAYSFATQALAAYDAAMKPKPELKLGWYVVQWHEGSHLECAEFLGGNWFRVGLDKVWTTDPYCIIRRIELEE